MFAEAQQARDDAGAAADRVGMTRLLLTDFRNYREVRLTVGTAPVVLTGPNGAGKTNLLEAVSFLAPGRGLRGAKLAEIDRWARPGRMTPLAAGRLPQSSRPAAAACVSAPGTIRGRESGGSCGSTVSRCAARRRSASGSASCG